ncbi:MAG TPA: hypothetical protein VGM37_13045 [Armatimonadota bacterium]|jgi:hypothetical protein
MTKVIMAAGKRRRWARYWHYEFTEAGQVADALRRFLEALEGAGG